MIDQEESEIIQDFGNITRAVMGSGLQIAEQAARRASMTQAETSAQDARERGVAGMIRKELSSPSFWKEATTEAVADRMTVASELAYKHNDASQAFMAGADRIRNQYGINVEDINRDHPGSPVERHQALRDAMDDYLASQRLNSESESKEAAAEKDPVLDAGAPAEEEKDAGAPAEEEKDSAQGKEQEASAAKQDETTNLVRAGEAESETQIDAKNAQGAEAKEAAPRSDDPKNPPAKEVSPAPALALSVWKEKGGKDADFPKDPTTTNPHTAMKNRKKVVAAAGSQRGQSQEISR